VQRIPVLVAGLRGVFAEIVIQLLRTQEDIQVLQRTQPDQVLAAARETDLRVVILELTDGDLPPLGGQLLAVKPSLKVLGIAGHGRAASLYELKPVCTPLGELSAEGLAAAVRSVACG
jgi:hypothetical protein